MRNDFEKKKKKKKKKKKLPSTRTKSIIQLLNQLKIALIKRPLWLAVFYGLQNVLSWFKKYELEVTDDWLVVWVFMAFQPL